MSDPVKPCWLPVTEAGDPGPFASHYHGTPWLAEGEAWPTHDDVPLVLILQMRVDTLPEPMAALLGGCGLVQFFYPAEESEATWDGGGGIVRLVRPPGMPFASPAPVSAVTSEFLDEAHALMENGDTSTLLNNATPRTPRAIVEWRRSDDFPGRIDAPKGYYGNHEDARCLIGDKLGGVALLDTGSRSPDATRRQGGGGDQGAIARGTRGRRKHGGLLPVRHG